MVYFSIKVQITWITRSSNCKIFCNTAMVLSYMYDSTVATCKTWTTYFINFSSLSLSLFEIWITFLYSLASLPPSLSQRTLSLSYSFLSYIGMDIGNIHYFAAKRRNTCGQFFYFLSFWKLSIIKGLLPLLFRHGYRQYSLFCSQTEKHMWAIFYFLSFWKLSIIKGG